MRDRERKEIFDGAYRRLLERLGPSRWWPGETPFEVMVGAILTQNTSWTNVEKSINLLKEKKLLVPGPMASLRRDELAVLIRSSGYYNQKAKKLLAFLEWYSTYQFSPAKIRSAFRGREDDLREELLSLHGVGRETADSILCYALELPFFVVDAYTVRWLARYRKGESHAGYESLRHAVESEFQKRYGREGDGRRKGASLTAHFNEFHALLVRLGKDFCKKRNPLCKGCPLEDLCDKEIRHDTSLLIRRSRH